MKIIPHLLLHHQWGFCYVIILRGSEGKRSLWSSQHHVSFFQMITGWCEMNVEVFIYLGYYCRYRSLWCRAFLNWPFKNRSSVDAVKYTVKQQAINIFIDLISTAFKSFRTLSVHYEPKRHKFTLNRQTINSKLALLLVQWWSFWYHW